MNKGDTIKLILEYTVNDTPIEEDQFEEMELQLNRDKFGHFNVKKLLSEGQLEWDSDLGKYVCNLSQEESFHLPDIVEYQLRCYENDSVVSSEIGSFNLGDCLSRKVLNAD